MSKTKAALSGLPSKFDEIRSFSQMLDLLCFTKKRKDMLGQT